MKVWKQFCRPNLSSFLGSSSPALVFAHVLRTETVTSENAHSTPFHVYITHFSTNQVDSVHKLLYTRIVLRAINMFHTPLLPCVFVTPPMIPAARRVPLSLPVPPAKRQPHPLRPRAWGLSIEWQESTFSQEGPWILRGGKGERE